MPLAEMRVKNFRAFADSGIVAIGAVAPIVGRNDVGKSGLLHALRVFFDPPKKGLELSDLHAKDPNAIAQIEVAFCPNALTTQEVQIDAKNKIHLTGDRLVDSRGLLRLRISISAKAVTGFEILIQDIDDDALFPLALKDHDELLELLAASGLQAVKAGKETNQQKRGSLRQKAQAEGRGLREAWVDALSVERKLRDMLPQFIFFADTANYGIGETPVQNQFRGIVDKALALHPNAKQIENDIRTTIQAEFDKVFERLSRLTDSVTSLEANARVSWKKAVDGISLSWGDPAGVSIPYEMRGAGVRRLFMVAYFQYEAAAPLHDAHGPKYIFGIEEPEVHLHPGAQRDLDAALRDLADLGHCVIFTTHSPVFVSTAPLRDVVLVVRPGARAEVKQSPNIDAAQIAAELGVEASDRLVGKNHVILVEGPRDVEFYSTVLALLHGAGHTALDPNTVLFLQCGGICNLQFSVTTCCMDSAGLNWAVIADSDRDAAKGPMGQDAQYLQATPPPSCSALKFLMRSNIESYLDAEVVKHVTGIDCVIPQYGKPTDSAGRPLGKRALKQIKNAGPIVAMQMGAPGIVAHSQDGNGNTEFVTIFEDIRQAFGL
ncbi:MAG: ATP-dependent endonuclease [Nitrospirales bacterium]